MTEELEKKLGDRLLYLLREQRKYFVRTVDQEKKIITNHIMFHSLEDELAEVQRKIGRENKKRIILECKEKGWPIPNFRKEAI